MQIPAGKYAWTAKVGDKGQIVIPKEAREVFGIAPGMTVLLLGDVERGLALVRADTIADLADSILSTSGDKSTKTDKQED